MHLEAISNEKRKSYISKSTWEMIEERNKLHENGAPEKEVKQLTRKIAKHAKDDKTNDLLEEFNENPKDENNKDLWKSVKQLKKKFTPNYIKMKNKNGMYVPPKP